MTSRFRHNATFAVALIFLSIAVFFAIFWYLALSTNVFQHSNTSTYRINVNNVNKTHGTTTPGPDLPPSAASPAFLDGKCTNRFESTTMVLIIIRGGDSPSHHNQCLVLLTRYPPPCTRIITISYK